MSSVRGQISVEYLVIIAFTLAILIPGILFFQNFSTSTSASLASAQYTRLGNEMLATAVQTVSQGEGGWLTLEARIPEGVRDITVTKREVLIEYDSQYGPNTAIFFSDVPLSNSTAARQDGSIFQEVHSGAIDIRFTAVDNGTGIFVAVEERYT